jgi:hypothetical protein
MSERIDYRTDAEVLLDHLADLARQIQTATDPADIRGMAGAQLVFIEQFVNAENQANAEGHERLWGMYQKLGLLTDREEFDGLFPAGTNGRLAPPIRRMFNPNVAERAVVVA